MANSRKGKALRNIAAILTLRPKMASQVSTTTLGQIPLTGDPSGALGMNVKNELGKRYTDEAGHSYRTPRKRNS
jgi:hypothetical protein